MYGDYPSSQPQTTPIIKIIPYEFTGQAGEYFRIWIVNLALTILTLGAYSAWAKVRNKRYFLGHTLLDGEPFDYLADPKAILRGRAIVVVVLLIFFAISEFYPSAQPVFTLLFALILPWLVVRALMFNGRNTAYRNITFGFLPNYRESYIVFILGMILVSLTLGLAYPYFVYLRQRFIVRNHEIGSTAFEFSGKPGQFFRIYILAILLFVALAFGIGTLAFFMFKGITLTLSGPMVENIKALAPALGIFGLLLYLIIYTFISTHVTNATLNNTHIGDHRLESRLTATNMLWITLTNTFAIACSLGLLIPWAKVRMVRYRCERLRMYVKNDLNDIFAGADIRVDATGEGAHDLLDIDLGL